MSTTRNWRVFAGGLLFTLICFSTARPTLAQQLTTEVAEVFSVTDGEIVQPEVTRNPEGSSTIRMAIEGSEYILDLQPHSVRTENAVWHVRKPDGTTETLIPGKPQTVRGAIRGQRNSQFVGSLLDSGLTGRITMEDDSVFFVEPIELKMPQQELAGKLLVYREDDFKPSDFGCGNSPNMLGNQQAVPLGVELQNIVPPGLSADRANAERPVGNGQGDEDGNGPANGPEGGAEGPTAGFYVAEIHNVADFEFYQDYGSDAFAVFDRMEMIINLVNAQYESEVGITHQISLQTVFTSDAQPFTTTDPSDLLDELHEEFASASDDLVHLFTGKELNGTTIGIAYIGATCNDDLKFGLSQLDFNGNLACATDLVAHELGHNWNANHCDCLSSTMNPFITCTNTFNPVETIPEIIAFRNSLDCLDIPLPANDSWFNSIGLGTGLPFSTSGFNVNATTQTDEQELGITDATVWWFFEADQDGMATIDTFGSDFDTVLHIYTGFELGFPNLIPVANNDQAGGTNQSQVTFPVVAGECYEIRVGGFLGAQGNIALNGSFVGEPPPNDDFIGSIGLGSVAPFTTAGTNVDATVQADEQNLSTTEKTVWWFFLAPEDGTLRIDTFGSDFDTVLHIYTGVENGFSELDLVAENDQAGGTNQSQVQFAVNGGQFYEIRVGGFGGVEGDILLNGQYLENPPLNDDFSNTFFLGSAFPLAATGTNIDATIEEDEQQLEITDSTVWWFLEAPEDGTVTIDTFGSDFDTVVHVYTGFELGFENLIPVTNNDQAGGTNQSEASFSVQSGQCYEIRVGGFFGDEGDIAINGSFAAGFLLGDVNGDGNVDLLDVQPFVNLLQSGGYQAEADINRDGVVNLLDVDPFVTLLLGT